MKIEHMLAKISIELEGPQAALLLFGLLVMGFGMFMALRWMERSRDRFALLLETEASTADRVNEREWKIEYSNPMLLGVPQTCVGFKVIETDSGLYLWKHRSLTGGTRTGIAYLPNSRYDITRKYGHLDIQMKDERSNKTD
ncbi:hypothetical protein [Coraliomargarita akajimensis]|uniref:Uncharacterized protein n=1 Tax=Coraliomargarita akajimensis (strain DSM 45221 / IAM 15411 / JCM 23193 / KCTC 12865 / 04OKA010-24) TaxID=583355 RepID=D5EI80_CORAD|nr:hypothetical protein [Coraliomargarita akajimensis]ADE56120.1 hypothetical protein Caka_3107 [Coraliomargarita akajimensis DSM 45221]